LWFSGEGAEKRILIASAKGYPDELVKAYLNRYPSILTGKEAIDWKTRVLSGTRNITKRLQEYNEIPDDVMSRYEDKFRNWTGTRILDVKEWDKEYDSRKKALKEKYIDNGKYDFDGYWAEMLRMRREIIDDMKALEKRIEENGIEPIRDGFRFRIVDKKTEAEKSSSWGCAAALRTP
jgi:hypothetical protein